MIYPSLFFFVLLFSLFFQKTKNKSFELLFSILIYLCLCLPLIFRENIGTDYVNYQNIYEAIKNNHWFNVEKGWELLNRFCLLLNLGFKCVIVISGSLTVICFISCFNKENYFLSILFFLLFLYFPSFNIIRQIMSLSLVFYLIKHDNLKPLTKFLVFLLALSIHISVIVLIPLFFFNEKEPLLKKTVVFLYCILCLLIPYINIASLIKYFFSLFDSKYSYYLDDAVYSLAISSSGITILLEQLTILLLLYNLDTNEMTIKDKNISYKLIIMSTLFYSLARQFVIFARFKYTFYLIFLFLIPFQKKNDMIVIFILSTLIICFTSILFIGIFNGINGIFPYESFLF